MLRNVPARTDAAAPVTLDRRLLSLHEACTENTSITTQSITGFQGLCTDRDGKSEACESAAAPQHRSSAAAQQRSTAAPAQAGHTTRSRLNLGHCKPQGLREGRTWARTITLGRATRDLTFGFLEQREKVTQQAGLGLRGGGHDGPETPQEPGSPRRGPGPRIPRTPGVQRRGRRGETHPGSNGAHGADPGGRRALPGLESRSFAARRAG
ncbi:hypothetical protein A6R68_13470 [Neotoma lepida]|uniref:Uncharacterized protein n=1 Tax=Neotoma lepida TaxID=56216 RepID=A0A1A6H126_NEOLE|nr:hypothetical protein A6R68_13470 [Neotoma lepida]